MKKKISTHIQHGSSDGRRPSALSPLRPFPHPSHCSCSHLCPRTWCWFYICSMKVLLQWKNKLIKTTHLTSNIPATSPGVKILLMVVTFIISVFMWVPSKIIFWPSPFPLISKKMSLESYPWNNQICLTNLIKLRSFWRYVSWM